MDFSRTTSAIQAYLDALGALDGEVPAQPVVRELLARSVDRLDVLCGSLLHRSYPRLTRPPLNLRTEELLGAVVERLLKAMNSVRPGNVRQFFAIANRHMRWELNDLARRLDERSHAQSLGEDASVPAPETSVSPLSPRARRLLEVIDELPGDEREVFDLVRLQGLSHPEAASVVGVSTKTVQRRLHRAVLLLAEALGDLRPGDRVAEP